MISFVKWRRPLPQATVTNCQVVVMAALLMAGCGPEPQPAASAEVGLGQPVVTATPHWQQAVAEVVAVGRTAAVDEVPLAFLTTGVVADVKVDTGDKVSSGQLLARLNTTDLQAERQQAQASLAKAERDLRRAAEMQQRGLIAMELLDNARTARDLAAAALTGVDYRLARSELRASASGRVISRLAEPGEVVAAGKPVVVMAGAEQGWLLKASVADRHALKLAVGQPAEVVIDALADQPLAAHISRLAGAADSLTGTVDLELTIDQPPEKLRSGLIGRARLALGQPQPELRLPLTALVDADGNRATLFLVRDGKAERQAVQIGRLAPPDVVIVSGLSGDERVVVAGAAYLQPGSAVVEQTP